jgi:hypothetical protein
MNDLVKHKNSELPVLYSSDRNSPFNMNAGIKAEFLTPNAEEVSCIIKYKDHYIVSGYDGYLTIYNTNFDIKAKVYNGNRGILGINLLENKDLLVYTDNSVTIYKITPPSSWRANVVYLNDHEEIISIEVKDGIIYCFKRAKNLIEVYDIKKDRLVKKEEKIQLASFSRDSDINDFSLTDDGKMLLRSRNQIIAVDFKTRELLKRIVTQEDNPRFAFNSKKQILCYSDNGAVQLYFFNTGTTKTVYRDLQFYPRLLTWFNDDQYLAIGAYASVSILDSSFETIFRQDYLHNNVPSFFYYDAARKALLSCHDEISIITGTSDSNVFHPSYAFRIKQTEAENVIRIHASNNNILWADESGVLKVIDLDTLTFSALTFDRSSSPNWLHSFSEDDNNYYMASLNGLKVLKKKGEIINNFSDLPTRCCSLITSYGCNFLDPVTGNPYNALTLNFKKIHGFDSTTERDEYCRFISAIPGSENKILCLTRSDQALVIELGKNSSGLFIKKAFFQKIPLPDKTTFIVAAQIIQQQEDIYLIVGTNNRHECCLVYRIDEKGISHVTTVGSDSSVTCITYLPDINKILCGGSSGDLTELDINNRKLVKRLRVKNLFITDIKPITDHRFVLAAADELWIIDANFKVLAKVKIFKNEVIFFKEINGSMVYYNPDHPRDAFLKDKIIFYNTEESRRIEDENEILKHLKMMLGSEAVHLHRYGYDLIYGAINLQFTTSPFIFSKNSQQLIDFTPTS